MLGLKGMALFQDGKLDDARVAIERSKAINPNDARVRNYLAQVLSALGAHTESELEFVAAVRLAPSYMEAWHNAGKTLLKHGKANEAVYALTHALTLAPTDKEILLKLVEADFIMHRFSDAEAYIRRLLVLDSSSLVAKLWLAAILRHLDKTSESSELLEEALLSTDIASLYDTLVLVGQSELLAGDLAASEYWITKAIALKPEQAQAYIQLAATHKFRDSERELVDKMETLLVTCRDNETRAMEFALGKAFSDLSDYDRSFVHYQAGNDLVRAQTPFDPSEFIKAIDQHISLFTKELLNKLPHGNLSETPILIVGTPRSGTTLTESIVSSHSHVAGAGEMDYWARVIPHIMPNLPDSFFPQLAKRVADEYLMFMRQYSPTSTRITDKMPGNFLQLGIIHAIFPNAKIIHVKRNPIDTCLSIYFQNFSFSHHYKWDLESLALWYEQYLRLMDHWRSVLPQDVMYEVRYDNLVDNIEGESRKLIDFLGLDWEPGILDYHKHERTIFTASKWQARQPVYKTSLERWRRYEKHLGPLLRLLKYA